VGDSTSGVRGYRMARSKMVSVTKPSYFDLNRLCSKILSKSRSCRETSSSRREGDYDSMNLPQWSFF
jgi:hypothetical protein